MNIPEVIKKVLLECDEGYACKRINCPYDDGKSLYNGSRCMLDVRKDALAYIQQLEAQVPKWISVEDRLPENGKIVFVHTHYFYEVLQWDGKAELWIDNYRSYLKDHVTHWMPLPEPPKEG